MFFLLGFILLFMVSPLGDFVVFRAWLSAKVFNKYFSQEYYKLPMIFPFYVILSIFIKLGITFYIKIFGYDFYVVLQYIIFFPVFFL